MNEPEGWPGRIWVEGRTVVHVSDVEGQAEMRRGPCSKSGLPVFHNPAMSGSRTRSVMLMCQCLEKDWVAKPGAPLRVLDGLAASAVRSRRWLGELPANVASRILSTAVDIDEQALMWAEANHIAHPPSLSAGSPALCEEGHQNGLRFIQGDLRKRVLESGWQWIDLDPFGPPTPYLDAVIQGLARKAVLEVTATDTAALCGSAAGSARRRYGAIAIVDDLRHDTAIRILLGHIATMAAKHDRHIEPLMCIFDDHHVRVSLLVSKGKEGANAVHENLGWRVHKPNAEEIEIAVEAGLHPAGLGAQQPHALLPWANQPSDSEEGRVSGPMWTGSLGREDVLLGMDENVAKEMCALDIERDAALISEIQNASEEAPAAEYLVKQSRRQAAKAVRGLAELGEVIDCPCTYPVDDLPGLIEGITGPPSPAEMVNSLKEKGWRAAKDVLMVPAVRTDAPWPVVVEAAKELAPN